MNMLIEILRKDEQGVWYSQQRYSKAVSAVFTCFLFALYRYILCIRYHRYLGRVV